MAFLAKGKKIDLIRLAEELGENVPNYCRVIDLKEIITKSLSYEEEFVKNMLVTLIGEREEEQARLIEERERENAKIAQQHSFEVEKMRLQLEFQRLSSPTVEPPVVLFDRPRFDMKSLIPNFNPAQDDMSLFLKLFERQLKFLKVEKMNWVAYLLGVLPNEVAKLIAREPEDKAHDYDHIRDVLLRRFKLSAETFRQLFASHTKAPESTWKDYYFEIRSYFEGWLSELKIENFDKLKDLMICDQMKKKVPPEVKEHFLDVCGDWTTPEEVVEKLDAYDNIRSKKNETQNAAKKSSQLKKCETPWSPVQRRVFNSNKFADPESEETERLAEKHVLTCYGCGEPGVMKSRCRTCNPPTDTPDASFNTLELYSFSTERQQRSVIEVVI